MSVTGVLKNSRDFSIGKTYAGAALSIPRSYSKTLNFLTSGVGANQINLLFDDAASIADGATLNLDLSGVLTDIFGTVIAAARIKYFYLENQSAAQTLTVGGGTNPAALWFADAASDKEIIQPGGWSEHVAPTATGWPVTNATADILKIVNSAGAVCPYRLFLGGADA